MTSRDHENQQPMRELEWLAHFFRLHGKEDKASEIFEQVKKLRRRAQNSLSSEEASDVLDFRANEDKQQGG